MLGCVMVKSLLWLSSTAPFPASITAYSPGGHPGVHVYMTAAKNHMGRKVCGKIYIKMNKLSLLKYLDHCIFHVYMCVPVTSVISQLKLDGVRQHTNRYSWFLWRYLLSNKKKKEWEQEDEINCRNETNCMSLWVMPNQRKEQNQA